MTTPIGQGVSYSGSDTQLIAFLALTSLEQQIAFVALAAQADQAAYNTATPAPPEQINFVGTREVSNGQLIEVGTVLSPDAAIVGLGAGSEAHLFPSTPIGAGVTTGNATIDAFADYPGKCSQLVDLLSRLNTAENVWNDTPANAADTKSNVTLDISYDLRTCNARALLPKDLNTVVASILPVFPAAATDPV